MKIESFNKINNLLIELVYLGVFFFLPLYFACFFLTANVFTLNKIVLFKALVWPLFLLTAVKIIFNFKNWSDLGIFSWAFLKKYLALPLFFILILGLASLFSVNPEVSFFGLYERQQGLSSFFAYFVFFLLLVININRYEQIKRIIFVITTSSTLVCLYGLLQALGLDFFSWNESTSLRITSTFGQPNFLASWLLLVLPITGFLFFKTTTKKLKILFFLVLILQLACLFLTYSRSGWIGLLGGFFIFGIYFIVYFKKNIDFKKLGISFLFFIFIFTSLWYFNPGFHNRVNNSFDFKKGSIASRLNFWQASLKAIKDRPVLGYGLDNQAEVLVNYYQKDWAINDRVNSYPNRAHNFLLDNLLIAGILGLISFLGLIYLFFKLAWENVKKEKNKILGFALIFALVCYLINLLFSFSVVVTEVYFWAFLAFLVVINSDFAAGLKVDALILKEDKKDLSFRQGVIVVSKGVAILCLVAIVFLQTASQIKIIIADQYLREIQLAQIQGENFKTYVLFDYLKSANKNNSYYDMIFGLMLADRFDDFYEETLIRPGREILLGILDNLKNNSYKNIFTRAKIYTALANEEREDYYDLAESNFQELISRSPEIPRTYYELAKMYNKKGDYNQAVYNNELALNSLPDVDSPYINQGHREIIKFEKYLNYSLLGESYLAQGEYLTAETAYKNALENNPTDFSIYKKISEVYQKNNDLVGAINYLQLGQKNEPNNYNWWFDLAKIYKEAGEPTKAREAVQKVSELTDNVLVNRRVEAFIQELNF